MLAFTFPGQGSQRQGMGRAWVDHPSWEVVAEASAVAGRDLARLLLEADQDELTLTANAQLATYVLGLVVLDAIERVGIEPTVCAGHSLGEYTALTAAGALGFEDGVRLVVERGEAMHHAAEERPGTMAAVLGAEDDDVEAACQRAEGEVWVANYNAPGQVVIAGTAEAVAVAGAIAKELGARRVMPFPVAGAFHTALMAPARARLRKALADAPFSAPEVPVVANVDARAHPGAEEWPGLLSAQLCSPVRWRQSLLMLSELGATQVVEVGPGGVLTGLARRTLPDAQALSVASPDDIGAPGRHPLGLRDLARLRRRPPGRAPLHLGAGGRLPRRRRLHPRSRPGGARTGRPERRGLVGPAGPAARRDTGRGRRRGRRGRPARPCGGDRGPDPLRRPGGRLPGPRRRAGGHRAALGLAPGQPRPEPERIHGSRAAGDGRVVLVTGGSRGIGLACARRFQALGDRVAVTYRSARRPSLSGADPGRDPAAGRAAAT